MPERAMPAVIEKPRRVVLCMGSDCNAGGQCEGFYERLKNLLGQPGGFGPPPRGVKWEIATCLSECERGPNLVIYPQKIWQHHLDQVALERLIETEILPYLKPD